MVSKSVRIGALATVILAFVAGATCLFQTSLSAQEDDRALAPELAQPPDGSASHPACAASSADSSSLTEECKSANAVGSPAMPKASPGPVRPGRSPIPRPGKSKTAKSGGGTVAFITFFAMLGLWCLRGWWTVGRPPRHP